MSRSLSFLIFFGVSILILGAAHYYMYVRLIRDPALPSGVSRGLSGLLLAALVSIPLALVTSRLLPFEISSKLLPPAFVWLGVLFICVCALCFADLLRVAYRTISEHALGSDPSDPSRRIAMARAFGAFAVLITGGAGAFAVKEGLARAKLQEVRVPLTRLPPALDGLTLVQLTDMHVGPTIGKHFVEDIVAHVNALEPDLVAITGDLVDGSVDQLREAVAPLARLRSRFGTYFVTGNHEYYSGCEAWCRELTRLGIRVLRNERVSIGDTNASFDLAGIEDYAAARSGQSGPDLARALSDRDENRELVLLAHQPRAITEAEKFGVGLQLSGHTHGGQIWPWHWLVRLSQPVVAGLERIGRSFIYVSSGTGYWGPPMRLGTSAEITRVILHSDRRGV